MIFPDLALPLKIIDLSAGSGAVWFGGRPGDVIAIDRRHSTTANVIADSRMLPFADDSFDLAVFDPPHTNFGPNSEMSKRYGHLTMDEIRDLIMRTSRDASRCVRRAGLLALKWCDRDVLLTKVFGLMPEWRPLFGHGVNRHQRRAHHAGQSVTCWVMMVSLK